jgi:acid phosphatase
MKNLQLQSDLPLIFMDRNGHDAPAFQGTEHLLQRRSRICEYLGILHVGYVIHQRFGVPRMLVKLTDFDIEKDPQLHFSQLTTTGPYAGTLSAVTTGVKLRTRYSHLLPLRFTNRTKTSFWASDCNRVIETARYFATGFFGSNWADVAHLHIIPETVDMGGDTLTPGATCKAYIEDKERGHGGGQLRLAEWRKVYTAPIRERLAEQNPDYLFTDDEVYAMQEMCGFETTIRGRSLWCGIFTREEWSGYEYGRDLVHYYRGGPGTPWAGVMGWLWLNATANLLAEGPQRAGPFFFSFVHDNDVVPMLVALDLWGDEDGGHPSTSIEKKERKWRFSDVAPMNARIIFERLGCETEGGPKQEFVRININDGIIPVPGCHNGPGGSCPLVKFLDRVKQKGAELGDFREKCGLGEDVPERITFLHQGKT